MSRALRIGLAFFSWLSLSCASPAPRASDHARANGPVGRERCVGAQLRGPERTEARYDDPPHRAVARMRALPGCRRSYSLSTNATLRDGQPANPREVREPEAGPVLRTGNVLFDALYALALDEVAENSVSQIRDDSFRAGAPIACAPPGCFQTGRLWTYVWTRDTAYSVDLALAAIDPSRSRVSLEFKLSALRGGGNLQIVQDTGSGGSYPVSTDRVAWALGAWELLQYLDGPERSAFAGRAFEAIRNTIEQDRRVVYDPFDGLYRGETSFLDWREQTYPSWAAHDTVHIAMSKALSTNVLHYETLRVAQRLAAERHEQAVAARWGEWADALRDAIRARFYLADEGLFGAFVPTERDPAPVHRWDLLGSALAVLSDVADPEQARSVVSRYPHAGKGPPVVWPEEPGVPIYHNRAFWPFVTAYWLRAARRARNAEVVTRNVWSMVRGAALDLSNMENFELVTGLPFFDDGQVSGPVINSQRQLWSVAGYLSMVQDVLFGLEAGPEGIRFSPFVPRSLRDTLFAGSDTIVLDRFPYRGRRITVVVHLPPSGASRAGAYEVGAMRLDGRAISRDPLPAEALSRSSTLEIDLVDRHEPASPVRIVRAEAEDRRALFGPATPRITELARAGSAIRIGLAAAGDPRPDAFRVYRDGAAIAADVPADQTSFTDTAPPATAPCYSVEAFYRSSGNTSHRSLPVCLRARDVQEVPVAHLVHRGGTNSVLQGRPVLGGWGAPGDTLEWPLLRPGGSGPHLLQLLAGNRGDVTTGVTCAVEHVVIEKLPAGERVAEGYLVIPHLGPDAAIGESSWLRVPLEAGRTYRVRIDHDPFSLNMSAFEHFAQYTRGRGGRGGASNEIDVAGLRLVRASH